VITLPAGFPSAGRNPVKGTGAALASQTGLRISELTGLA
jgi:hypothetical protein